MFRGRIVPTARRATRRRILCAAALLLGLAACTDPQPEPAASSAAPSRAASPTPSASAEAPTGELSAEVRPTSLELERISAAAAFDATRSVLYLWGGRLPPLRPGARPLRANPSTLEALDLRAGELTTLKLLGSIPTGVHVASGTFDARASGTMLVFGGWPELGHRPTDALSRIALGSKMPAVARVAHVSPWPAARNGAATWFDSATGSLYVCGGDAATGRRGFEPQDDLWRFDTATDHWERLTPSGEAPPARWNAASAFDESSRKAYLFGGAGKGPRAFDARLYELDLTSLEWRVLATTGQAPPSLQGTSLTFDAGLGALLLAGGLRNDGPPPAVSTDLYLLDLRSLHWLRVDGGKDARRRDHCAAYDPTSKTHFLVGGHVSEKVGNYYETGAFVRPVVEIQLRRGRAGSSAAGP